MRVLRGIAVTGGYGLGPAYYVSAHMPRVSERSIAPSEVRAEIQRYHRALARARTDLDKIRRRGLRRLEGRLIEIFDAQLMMLDDREFYREVIHAIRSEHVSAEWAYHRQIQRVLKVLRKSKDDYLRQMEGDIEGVARRVIQNLQGFKQMTLAELKVPSVLLAEQLSPADLVQLPRDKVLGIATQAGSRTDHTALVARSLGLPAVVGVKGSIKPDRKGQRILVDAEAGRVFFSPGRSEVALHRTHHKRLVEARVQVEDLKDKQARTADGHRVILKANIELLQEADVADAAGAEGVGLFRTEFLFISSSRLPDEATQVKAYSELAQLYSPRPVTLRVYDLGGDKLFYSHRSEFEPNPALGWRAVRLLLDRPALFRTQLRAMYMAAAKTGNIQIMFPLVSSFDEWKRITDFARKVRDDLEAEGVQLANRVPLGVMIEVPALAMEAAHLAAECDFFSVGTNDLIQYLLAVDRQNPMVADRHDAYHPAVLKILSDVVHAAHSKDIPISICGDLASDLRALPLLIGLGFDELSTVPSMIPQIKAVLGDFTKVEAETLTKQVLGLKSAREISAHVNRAWRRWKKRRKDIR